MICSREYVMKALKQKSLRPKKMFSQNFLIDSNIAQKIIDKLEIDENDTIVEIGPGLGALSELLITKTDKVFLYEIDSDMVNHLNEVFKDVAIVIKNQDFLKEDLINFKNKKVKFVSNVPYNVTSPIIEKIACAPFRPILFEFMIQKEVYERLKAKDGKDYGPLNILIEYIGKLEFISNVYREAYIPAPHVDSVILLLKFNQEYDPKIAEELKDILKKSFTMRRKTLFNNLKAYFGKEYTEAWLKRAQLNNSIRAEELTLKDYLKLIEVK